MGSKAEEFLYEYRITNTRTGEVYQARGWTNVISLTGLNKNYNRTTMERSKKWNVEIVSEPDIWDEAAYRQSLYATSKSKYPGYELKKKERDRHFETRKRLRLRGHKNLDGSIFTAEQHDAMLKLVCEVCGTSERTCVDHCHTTGYVRGTLCNHCNLALGYLRDSLTNITQLHKYLENHNKRVNNCSD